GMNPIVRRLPPLRATLGTDLRMPVVEGESRCRQQRKRIPRALDLIGEERHQLTERLEVLVARRDVGIAAITTLDTDQIAVDGVGPVLVDKGGARGLAD